MSDWKCTGECRWLKRDGGPKPPVLQQLWENVEMASQDWLPLQYHEWRDVPIVQWEEPDHE